MKSKFLSFIAVASMIVAGTALAKEAAKETGKPDLKKVKCMFSGKACKEAAAADHNGAKVHFCCNNCVSKFKKDAKKYATKANHHIFATGQAKQKGCPISGGKAKDGTEVKVAGAEVKFCCKNCQKKANGKKGDEQLELVFSEKAFKKGFKVAEKK